MKEKNINIHLLLNAVCQHWKKMLIFALICAFLAAGYKYMDGRKEIDAISETDAVVSNSTVEDHTDYNNDEEIIQYQIDSLSEYINNSFYFKIDANAEGTATADISVNIEETPDNTSVYQQKFQILQAYIQYAKNGVDLSDLARKYGTKPAYLRELISVDSNQLLSSDYVYIESDSSLNAPVTLKVIFTSEEGAKEIMDTILTQLTAYHDEVTAQYGEHSLQIENELTATVTDTGISDKINSRLSTINSLINGKNSFSNAASTLNSSNSDQNAEGFTRNDLLKSMAKYFVLGFIGGILLWLILGIIWLLASGRIYSSREFNRQYGLAKIAALPASRFSKLSRLDRFILRDAINYCSSSDLNACYQIANENILELLPADITDCTIGLVGDLPRDDLEKLADNLRQTNKELQIKVSSDPTSSPKDLHTLRESNYILLAFRSGSSNYRHIDSLLSAVDTCGKPILGSISEG